MRLLHGECIHLMSLMADGIFDCVIVDPPYGVTSCDWDKIIPFDLMWEQLHRIVKPEGAICIFGKEPFSSKLRVSNLSNFKYDWVWVKAKTTNFLNVKKQPLRKTELISVFYRKQCLYNPQLTPKDVKNIRPTTTKRTQADLYGKMSNQSQRDIPVDMGYPTETLHFNSCCGSKGKSNHPTEKPIKLLEYLINTYTNEGDQVLDFTMGSGSTGVACMNLNRNFTGIEKEKSFFNIAAERIKLAR